jgi:uncharacterized protein
MEAGTIPGEEIVAAELRDLPLFPLNVVLFPGMALPLHVFEPRYREMIGRCLESDEGFGVVLIQEGQEVGEPAVPFEVGTVAQIASVERLPDGRMNLVTVGTRRFRCVEHLQIVPHRVARVQWLDDEQPPSADCTALATEVRGAVEEYLHAVYTLADQPRRGIEFPDDPVALSFQGGCRAADRGAGAPGPARDDRDRRAPAAGARLPAPRDPHAADAAQSAR